MKRIALLTASLLAGAALLPHAASALPPDSETTSETFVTEEVVVEEQVEAPPATIDLSGFQADEEALSGIPGEPPPDAGLLEENWPLPEEEAVGPLKPGRAEKLRQLVRLRQIRTIAQRDPLIQNEKRRAEAARTPEGRRTLMRNYYFLLYQRMVKLEPSLKEDLQLDLVTKLARYEQRRIRPSILVEPYQPLPGSRLSDYQVEEVTVTVVEQETASEE